MRKNIFENEEEYIKIDEIIIGNYVGGHDRITRLNFAKNEGLIRKSSLEEAREKTDEYMKTIGTIFIKIDNHEHMASPDLELKQLIQSERAEADKILNIEKISWQEYNGVIDVCIIIQLTRHRL